MQIINKLTLKHLRLNPKRTTVTIIGIILSTALMVGIGLLFSSFHDYSIRQVQAYQGTYHAKYSNINQEQLNTIKENHDLTYNQTTGLGFSKVPSDNPDKPYLYIEGVSHNFFQELTLIEGRFPKNNSEIVIPRHLQTNGNVTYKIDDTLDINYGDRLINGVTETNNTMYDEEEQLNPTKHATYKIVGIIERSNYEDYSACGYTAYTSQDNFTTFNIYVTFKTPKQIMNKAIKLANQINYEEKSITYNTNLLAMYGETKYRNINNTIITMLIIMLSIVSVACIIVIYNAFAISVMERKKQLGILSSIGTTKHQLFKTVFFEATICGIIGITLGVIGAYIGIGIVITIINNLLQEMLDLKLHLVTNLTYLCIPIVFMTVVIYISAMIPARRASRIAPIEAIRATDDIKIPRKKVKVRPWVTKLFGIEGEIALKNMKRNKKKYRITIISLFISIVMFITFSSYFAYTLNTANDMTSTYDYDISIHSLNPTEEELSQINSLLNHDDVKKASEYQIMNVDIQKNKKMYTQEYQDIIKYIYDQNGESEDNSSYDSITVISLDDASFNEYCHSLGIKPNKMIIFNEYKRITYQNNNRKMNKVKVLNDDAQLNICHDTDCTKVLNNLFFTTKEYYALDNISELEGIKLVVNEKTYAYLKEYQNNNNDNVTINIAIKADHFNALDKIGEDLNKNNNTYYINITKEMQMTNNLILVMKILAYGFIALVTLIGVTSVFNTINTSMALRTKEFAVLRSVGLTKHGFNKMLFFESLFFGIKSLFYALPVSAVIICLIHMQMFSLTDSKLIIPWNSVIIVIIAVFTITLVTMLYASNKIKNNSILEQIRDDNI